LQASACLAASLLVAIAVVKWWPPPDPEDPSAITFSTRGQEVIAIEEIMPTRQAAQKPPPPPPLPPIVVSDDVVLDEIELDLADTFLSVEDPGQEAIGEAGDQPVPSAQLVSAEVGPKPVRFVEPEYTREARKKKIRAEVVVEVLVDERGRVKEARVLERFLLGKDDTEKEPVQSLGYGLEEAALAAAGNWMFRPARQNGQAVRSYTTLTFSFGV